MVVAACWWRVHPGKEEQFRAAWRRGTELITAKYGSLGSRLHRTRDGRFIGVARMARRSQLARRLRGENGLRRSPDPRRLHRRHC